MITLALNKGRILDEVLPLLAAAQLAPLEDPRESRRLIFPTQAEDLRIIVVRGSDVPTCVEHGAADLGVTGKDTLLEYGDGDFYEPLDLGIARCRLMTAGPAGARERRPARGRLRIATKFVNIARRHYAAAGRQVDLIHLGGAQELAPLIGLADHIVDIVDTGRTLKANGLEAWDVIAEISTRLIVNKAAMKRDARRMGEIVGRIGDAVAAREAAA